MESHQQQPILNTVEVINGGDFKDSVLRRRLQPLLEARTLQQLLDNLDPVARNLSVLGRASYELDVAGQPKSTLAAPLPIKTIVTLSNTRPAHPTGISFLTTTDMAAVTAHHLVHNRLGYGEQLSLAGQLQLPPYGLGSGSAQISVPMPIGAGKFAVKGFFFNQDRPWAAYSLASHGLSALISVPWFTKSEAHFGVEAIARNVHSIGDAASDTVRAAAGANSVKVAAVGRWEQVSKLYKLSVDGEVAGGPGDAHHKKLVASANAFHPLIRNNVLVADVTTSLGWLTGEPRLLDHFVLGGPKDVYGVKYNSMGPKDGNDFVGGQAFYNAKFALTSKLPGQSLSPLRLTALVNAAALRLHAPSSNLSALVGDLAKEVPVVATAAGLTYRTSQANMELLYVVPLQTGAGDIAQGGLHLGLGLTFD